MSTHKGGKCRELERSSPTFAERGRQVAPRTHKSEQRSYICQMNIQTSSRWAGLLSNELFLEKYRGSFRQMARLVRAWRCSCLSLIHTGDTDATRRYEFRRTRLASACIGGANWVSTTENWLTTSTDKKFENWTWPKFLQTVSSRLPRVNSAIRRDATRKFDGYRSRKLFRLLTRLQPIDVNATRRRLRAIRLSRLAGDGGVNRA